MKTDRFKQCRFRKEVFTGVLTTFPVYEETISYIPSWAAVKGNRVQLKSLDDEFWEVTECGNEIDKDTMDALSRGYKDFQESLKGGGIDEAKKVRP